MPAEPEGINLSIAAPFEGLVKTLLEVWRDARGNMAEATREQWDIEGLKLYRVTIGFAVRQIEKAQAKLDG